MSNCPKCGNQLQDGVTVCSICGTNILEKTEATPTAPAPAPASTPEAAPAPAPAAPAQPAPAPAPASPAPTTEEIAPVVERVVPSTPVPSIPTSLTNSLDSQEPTAPTVEAEGPKLTKKPKKGINKGLVLGFLVVVLLGVGAYMFLGNGSSMKGKNQTPTTKTNFASTKVSSNGFKFDLVNGWIINEDGKNVIIVNESSTVAIKLVYSKANLADVSKDQINQILIDKNNYTDTEINQIKLTGRDTYQVNTTVNDIPVQVYFINGGSDLTLGATVVYQTKESKTKFEPEVTEMIGSLSYANDSIKALDIMSSYSQMFGIYDKVISEIETTGTEIPDLPDQPNEDGENKLDEGGENQPNENNSETPNENNSATENPAPIEPEDDPNKIPEV